jgi:hypothetical protein
MKPDRLSGISLAGKNEKPHCNSLRLTVNFSTSDEKTKKVSKSCIIKREKFKRVVVGESGVGWDWGWMGQGLDGTEGFYLSSCNDRKNFF